MDARVRDLLVRATAAVDTELPHVEFEDYAQVGQDYWDVSVVARLLPSGYIGARWIIRSASYSARWSNPMWSLLELPVVSEHAQILGTVRQAIATHGSPAPLALTDDHLATANLPINLMAKFRCAQRLLKLSARWWYEWFWLPPWQWRW